jgi:hypothetical protein
MEKTQLSIFKVLSDAEDDRSAPVAGDPLQNEKL